MVTAACRLPLNERVISALSLDDFATTSLPNVGIRLKMSLIEQEYQSRMQTLSPKERVARSMAMLKWTREMLARQIVKEHGPRSDERLRWEVALRLYGSDSITRPMIEKKLADVPD